MNHSAYNNKLLEQINDWNNHRLDLFALSSPNEIGQFNGVVRFFYLTQYGRYHTKCIRVSSASKAVDIVELLREKFSTLDVGLMTKRCGIYEHHANGVRRLTNEEYPLLVQLNWSRHDREGKFVLMIEDSPKIHKNRGANTPLSNGMTSLTSTCLPSGRKSHPTERLRHRWTPRRDKPQSSTSKRGPLGCTAGVSWGRHHTRPRSALPEASLNCLVRHNNRHDANDLLAHSPAGHQQPSLPDSSFTRTISNPEKMMKSKRQKTLEAKLMQILQQGSPDIGGTLKIYGGHICPEVPYKTLLLSMTDTVASVIRQTLDKYGLDDADPNSYCLIMRTRTADEIALRQCGTEELLVDTDNPLGRLFASNAHSGSVVTFELRPRPLHLLKYRPMRTDAELELQRLSKSWRSSRSSSESDSVFACLLEMDRNVGDVDNPTSGGQTSGATGNVYPLLVHRGEVCIGTASNSNFDYPYMVTLPTSSWPEVESHHLIIWRPPIPPGISSTMAATEATSRRGGWLACRPCPKPPKSHPPAEFNMQPPSDYEMQQFTKVYVNDQLLQPTTDNRACVYWLSPGDIISLGSGQRSLKIWPGNGTGYRILHMTTNRSEAQCPDVPKHQRLYASNWMGSGKQQQSPRSSDTSAPHPTNRAPAFLSPLLQSPNHHHLTHYPTQTNLSADWMKRSDPLSQPTSTAVNRSPIDSTSASSSSLSNSPHVTDRPFPNSYRNRTGIMDFIHSSPYPGVISTEPPPPHSTATPDSLSFRSGSTFPVFSQPQTSCDQLTASEPIQLSTSSCENTLVQETSHNPDSLSSDATCLTTTATNSPNHCGMIKTSRSKGSTISDRLPCQMAFAPASVDQLLDWLIIKSLTAPSTASSTTENETSSAGSQPDILTCPLGPAFVVYLMLRAIHRQCDRFELIEARQMAKESLRKDEPESPIMNKIAVHQRRRRQRQLLNLFIRVVELFQRFESTLLERMQTNSTNNTYTDDDQFYDLLQTTTRWLANASQLLHFVTRDADLLGTFERFSTSSSSDGYKMNSAHSAWSSLHSQLSEVVQTAFIVLTDLCVTRLDQVSLGHLITKLSQIVSKPQPSPTEETTNQSEDSSLVSDTVLIETFGKEPDAVLLLLSDTLSALHSACANPAFVVQLFARILHRLNARLFNFLLGLGESPVALPDPTNPTHISALWGRVLHHWIHTTLCAWATSEGLGVATECYLQRVSQAAELMMADMSSVESLYNVAVDLIGLNSKQVRTLLSNHSSNDMPDNVDGEGKGRIPDQWVEFVVSGVQLVADRILAEEDAFQPYDEGAVNDLTNTWIPQLAEPIDLMLPLLLPEDSYPSETPIPPEPSDESVSGDSGVYSRPGSAKHRDSEARSSNGPINDDPLITVDAIRSFLTPAILAGWCRLSVRPILADSSNPPSHLSWSVYLHSRSTLNTEQQPSSSKESPINTGNPTTTQCSPIESESTVLSDYMNSLCSAHCPFTVVVPKLGHSLGLNIVAAKSEDGLDLGIYIRGIIPQGGASLAKLVDSNVSTNSVLRPGDHLIAVDNRSVVDRSQETVVQLVAAASDQVRLTVVHNQHMHSLLTIQTGTNSPNVLIGSLDRSLSLTQTCPECNLGASLPTNPTKLLSEHSVSTVDPPPPVPSAHGPVLHLPPEDLRSPVNRVRTIPVSSVPYDHHSHPSSVLTNMNGTYNSSSSFSSTTTYNSGPRCPYGSDLVSKPPCHRPKGQSMSFDDWISTSRLKDLCDQLTNDFCLQTGENESVLSIETRSITDSITACLNTSERDQVSTQSNSSCDGTKRDTISRVSDDISQLQLGSKPPRTFVPTASVLPSSTPMTEPRTRPAQHHNTWYSRSMGDLSSTASSHLKRPTIIAPSHLHTSAGSGPRALSNGRVTSTTIQRRHTTITALNRFNLGPRPEPFIHKAFTPVSSSS